MKKTIFVIVVMIIIGLTAVADELCGFWIPIDYENTVTSCKNGWSDETIFNVHITEWDYREVNYSIWYTRGAKQDEGHIWTEENSINFDISTREGRDNFWRAISMICELRGIPKKGLY